jgi:hypothetical protein
MLPRPRLKKRWAAKVFPSTLSACLAGLKFQLAAGVEMGARRDATGFAAAHD